LGGGPSLKKTNYDLIKHRRIIGINNAYGDPICRDGTDVAIQDGNGWIHYKPREWVDACYFVDGRWFTWHFRNLKEFPGIVAHCLTRMARAGTIYFNRGKPNGIDERPEYICWNGNAGLSAINFAYHLGVRKVVLLGYDMRRVEDAPNWHNDHPSPDKNPYFKFLRRVPIVAKDAERLGLEIINCTPGSAITRWPIMTLEEYLEKEKSEVANAKPESVLC
jgi:hypothetical protein